MKNAEGCKHSKQRDAIMEVLCGTKSHPTANWVYEEVRKTIPNISLGTVYRNLAKLSQSGSIQKISTGEDTDRFDYNEKPHYHFYCNSCCRLLDMELPYNMEMNDLAKATEGAEISWHNLIFYGNCKDCLQNK